MKETSKGKLQIRGQAVENRSSFNFHLYILTGDVMSYQKSMDGSSGVHGQASH